MFINALIISISLIVVASLLRRIRLAKYSLIRSESDRQFAVSILEDYQHDFTLLSSLAVEESGQVSFLALVPDDPTTIRFNEYVIDYGSLLSYERGDSESIVVYNL